MLLLEICENQARQTYTFLNSFKRDLAKPIYITLGVYEFLNIHIFNWYEALYLAFSSTFGILILSEQFHGFVQLPPW